MRAMEDLARRLTRIEDDLRYESNQSVHHLTGTILSWDPDTFRGTVRLSGSSSTAEDLPVKAATDALTFAPGDNVAIFMRGATPWIDGLIVKPGEAGAQRAIAFLQTNLAKAIVDELVEELLTSPAGIQLAAFVMSNRVHPATVNTVETTSSGSFTDLATVGPTVSDVDITSSGLALVWASAGLDVDGGESALMGVEVSGATSRSPDPDETLALGNGSGNATIQKTSSTIIPVTGLNEGTHTFEAKYQSFLGGSVGFGARTLVVFAF